MVFSADVLDRAAQSPLEHGHLHDAGPEGGDCLRGEHGSWGDFHVLAQFKILGEVETLRHGNVAVGFEEHHCDGAAGLDVSGYEFTGGQSQWVYGSRVRKKGSSLREDIEADLDARHALDHADGDEPDEGNDY